MLAAKRACSSSPALLLLLDMPKVALMFLTVGNLYHEATWRLWFESAAGQLPIKQAKVGLGAAVHELAIVLSRGNCGQTVAPALHAPWQEAICSEDAQLHTAMHSCSAAADTPLGGQHLYTVYVHAPPTFKGNVFAPAACLTHA
jgi:hypothetical protein